MIAACIKVLKFNCSLLFFQRIVSTSIVCGMNTRLCIRKDISKEYNALLRRDVINVILGRYDEPLQRNSKKNNIGMFPDDNEFSVNDNRRQETFNVREGGLQKSKCNCRSLRFLIVPYFDCRRRCNRIKIKMSAYLFIYYLIS